MWIGEPLNNHQATNAVILYTFRLPRTVLAFFVGGGLAICGLLMQTYFKNPLAGPGVLGISAVSSFGAAISLLAFKMIVVPDWLSSLGLFSFSMAMSLIYTLLLFLWSSKFFNNLGILLVGIMASYFINALISILIFFSDAEEIRRFVYWGFGSFEGVAWAQIQLIAITVLIAMAILLYQAKKLNVYLLGDDTSLALGINLKKLNLISIAISCLVVSLVTCLCGPIGFVGLAGAHVARLFMKTADHKWLFLASLLTGGSIALWGDIIARLPGTAGVLPVNAVLAIIGAPVIVFLILSQKTSINAK